MGYAQYLVADGFPIVNAHGGLACRLDVAAANDVAANNQGPVDLTRPAGCRAVGSQARPHRP
jgi:hypothetical protein